MAAWDDVPIIDALTQAAPGTAEFLVTIPKQLFRDDESLDAWPSTSIVKYLFGPSGDRTKAAADPVQIEAEQQRWGIAHGQVMLDPAHAAATMDALAPFGDRFIGTLKVDPFGGGRSRRLYRELLHRYPLIRSLSLSPFAIHPSTPLNSKEFFLIYELGEELEVPVLVNVGVPGPRVPSMTQDPMLLDEVCWQFPDLSIVMKHGGEPWEELCVKMMLKWPNLFYMTSAFTPRYYPKAIVQYMNTRGTDRVMFAGYWPLLDYGKVFGQFDELPLREHVWPAFLHDNAARVFGLA